MLPSLSIAAALTFVLGGFGSWAAADTSSAATELAEGSHDFDFELGRWNTHLRRLQHPLTGSTSWVEYDGTTQVRSVLGTKANLVELEVSGPAGSIAGISLRLYEPDTHQWTLNFANIRDGRLTSPVIGSFRAGRGIFYGQDALDGRAIFVRFVITRSSADAVHFEQAFSADGGQTWEVNWIADDVKRAP